tara:strand:+ start:1177 stop:2613 length:1437 start_codon:yes stop_codon:yes gene_type:complete
MALNPFFQQGSSGEQSLVQSLINEQLRMYGVDVHYMPRKYITEKTILKEVSQSTFDDAYPLEAYIDNFDGYGDNPTMLSKFGIQATNEVTLIISKERFETYISPLMKNEANVKLSTRPKEGDLIYFPFGDRLFEIKYVEHEKPFYQLKNTYVYELRCELFRYEDEVIDTGVDEIDDTLEGVEGVDGEVVLPGQGGTQKLTLAGSAVQATAITGIVNGGIQQVFLSNRGNSYTYAPRVAISSAPSGGLTGIGTAYLLGGITVCAGAADINNSKKRVVQSINLVNPGYGYTNNPQIEVFGDGTGVAATSKMENAIVGIVTLTAGGSGYSTTPTITFTAQNGISTVSAAATAIVSTAGTISAIHITHAGAGYTVAPTVTISSPGSAGQGNYSFNEIVTGSVSGATARVRTWSAVTNEIEISNIDGTFKVNEDLTGASSGAVQRIRLIDYTNFDEGYGENDEFELQADAIIDFSEGNPFGQP